MEAERQVGLTKSSKIALVIDLPRLPDAQTLASIEDTFGAPLSQGLEDSLEGGANWFKF
jgi:hypothetical protein